MYRENFQILYGLGIGNNIIVLNTKIESSCLSSGVFLGMK